MNRTRIVLAGGSGFIGSALARECLAQYGEVVVLTRSPRKRDDAVKEVEWSGGHIGEWIQFLNGADAVVNLAGKNIDCRHTEENVRALTESRVNSVCAIGQALEHVKAPPHVWVQASAIGYYGNAKERICDEASPNGSDTLSDICRQWEHAFNHVPAPGTRKVLLRMGIVLGRDGGALPVLARLTKWFLGGSAGSGEQFMSWIQIKDLMRIVEECITRRDWSGTFNAVAPNPVRNAEFMRDLRRALHRPWSPPAPAVAIKMGARLMKTDPSLALDSCRAVPKRLTEAGFRFQFPELGPALKDIF
jgi:uncharacterized protein (TIGR01777 family)